MALHFIYRSLGRLYYTIIIISLVSCKKEWFDAKSNKSLTIPSTFNDFEYLLDDYSTMNLATPGLGEIGSDGHYTTDSRWQLLSNTNNSNAQKNAYIWSYAYPYLEVIDWNAAYKRIFQANLTLYGLAKLKPKNSIEKEQYDRIKGNALFHRAKNYYDLAQIYAQPYSENTASSDLGIVLKEGIDVSERSTRSTVRQTYDMIISDLTEAIPLLPITPKYLTRGSKTNAFALLARTYLMMSNYSKAFENADLCLRNNGKLIDYNTIPSNNSNIGGRFNEETLFYSIMANWSLVFSTNFIFIDTALYDLYDENDLRKSRYFTHTSGGIRFKGTYSGSTLQFSGIATDEIYLIRAECNARAGNTADALNDLNSLVRNRWKNDVVYNPITAANAEEALVKILTERKKELLLRGIRWADLRRLNLDDRFKVTIVRTIGGQTYNLEPNSFRYTFPVPNDERDMSMIAQSPGW